MDNISGKLFEGLTKERLYALTKSAYTNALVGPASILPNSVNYQDLICDLPKCMFCQKNVAKCYLTDHGHMSDLMYSKLSSINEKKPDRVININFTYEQIADSECSDEYFLRYNIFKQANPNFFFSDEYPGCYKDGEKHFELYFFYLNIYVIYVCDECIQFNCNKDNCENTYHKKKSDTNTDKQEDLFENDINIICPICSLFEICPNNEDHGHEISPTVQMHFLGINHSVYGCDCPIIKCDECEYSWLPNQMQIFPTILLRDYVDHDTIMSIFEKLKDHKSGQKYYKINDAMIIYIDPSLVEDYNIATEY